MNAIIIPVPDFFFRATLMKETKPVHIEEKGGFTKMSWDIDLILGFLAICGLWISIIWAWTRASKDSGVY